jgi:hypothetical protein
LTSKKFHAIHQQFHADGTVALFDKTPFCGFQNRICLIQLLKEWLEDKYDPQKVWVDTVKAAMRTQSAKKELQLHVWLLCNYRQSLDDGQHDVLAGYIAGLGGRMGFSSVDVVEAAWDITIRYSKNEIEAFLHDGTWY